MQWLWYNNNRNDLTGGQDMKKIIFSSMVFLLFPVMSHGAGYVLATYGSGGEVEGPSYGIEMGGIFLSPYHPAGGAFSVGLGISVADTDEDPPIGSRRRTTTAMNRRSMRPSGPRSPLPFSALRASGTQARTPCSRTGWGEGLRNGQPCLLVARGTLRDGVV